YLDRIRRVAGLPAAFPVLDLAGRVVDASGGGMGGPWTDPAGDRGSVLVHSVPGRAQGRRIDRSGAVFDQPQSLVPVLDAGGGGHRRPVGQPVAGSHPDAVRVCRVQQCDCRRRALAEQGVRARLCRLLRTGSALRAAPIGVEEPGAGADFGVGPGAHDTRCRTLSAGAAPVRTDRMGAGGGMVSRVDTPAVNRTFDTPALRAAVSIVPRLSISFGPAG